MQLPLRLKNTIFYKTQHKDTYDYRKGRSNLVRDWPELVPGNSSMSFLASIVYDSHQRLRVNFKLSLKGWKTGWVSLSAAFPLTFHISDLYSDPSKPRHLFPSYRWPRSCQHLWRYFIRSCRPSCALACSIHDGHTPYFGYMTCGTHCWPLWPAQALFFVERLPVKIILVHEQP